MPSAAQTTEVGAVEGFLALPIHPVFVHFPIALLTIVTVLVYLRHGRGRDEMETFIMPALTIGTAFMPLVFWPACETPVGVTCGATVRGLSRSPGTPSLAR